jgi:hypothetical protein
MSSPYNTDNLSRFREPFSFILLFWGEHVVGTLFSVVKQVFAPLFCPCLYYAFFTVVTSLTAADNTSKDGRAVTFQKTLLRESD